MTNCEKSSFNQSDCSAASTPRPACHTRQHKPELRCPGTTAGWLPPRRPPALCSHSTASLRDALTRPCSSRGRSRGTQAQCSAALTERPAAACPHAASPPLAGRVC